jgi:phosphatidate phosphatase APP1
LIYRCYENTTGKKDRSKKFEGRINISDIDTTIFVKEICNDDLIIYSVVFSKAFKRDIKLDVALFYKDGKEASPKLYFSTDLQQVEKKL